MSVHNFGWCRVEGAHVPNLGERYGTFVNISPSQTVVFFGTPEICIYHPFDTVNGVVYKTVPVKSLNATLFDTINHIDENYQALINAIGGYNKRVTIEDGCYYWREPFTISETSVIFYTSSDHDYFEAYSIIYVDKQATPAVIAITADYRGSTVPVGENFRVNDIVVHMIYEDMQDAIVAPDAWNVTSGIKVLNEGENIVDILYVDPDGHSHSTTCTVTGVKNITSITASYDSSGPKVASGQKVNKKYISVIAYYTDGTSSFVSDYTLIGGMTVTTENEGKLTAFYKGKSAEFIVPMYEVQTARLLAYYNGPDVEIGYGFLKSYVIARIYYEDENGNGFNTDVNPESCSYSTTDITQKGVNQIRVSCNTDGFGTVSTIMSVTGVDMEVKLDHITAEYRGPEVTVGTAFSFERLVVNAHYNNGTVTTIRNYTVPSNIVRNVGNNIYTVTYSERGITKQCDILVIGIPKEDTVNHNLFDIMLKKHYPELTTVNNRYRGPAEATKMRHYSRFIYDMINKVNGIFISIEKEYKDYCRSLGETMNVKYDTLNDVIEITRDCDKWLTDKRFTSGKYIMETEE